MGQWETFNLPIVTFPRGHQGSLNVLWKPKTVALTLPKKVFFFHLRPLPRLGGVRVGGLAWWSERL